MTEIYINLERYRDSLPIKLPLCAHRPNFRNLKKIISCCGLLTIEIYIYIYTYIDLKRDGDSLPIELPSCAYRPKI